MPLYEYQCQECGTRTEELQRFSDPPLTICKSCGGPLTKLLSAPAFHLKGSGWYATDYGGKKGESDSGASAEGSESKKSEGSAGKESATSGSGSAESSAKKDTGGSAAKAPSSD